MRSKMYYGLLKNYFIKSNYKKNELFKLLNILLLKEFNNIPLINVYFLKLNYRLLLNHSSFTFRCTLSGRARSVLKNFMLSRMFFKKLALNGYIIGMKKASW